MSVKQVAATRRLQGLRCLDAAMSIEAVCSRELARAKLALRHGIASPRPEVSEPPRHMIEE
jgi:hypothetical protein